MSTTTPEKLMVAPAEAARIAGVSKASIYAMLGAKRIVGRKYGKRTLIELASLRDWLASLPAYGSTAA